MKNISDELSQFAGTEQYHRIGIAKTVATDGVAHLCKEYKCYWLFDEISLVAQALSSKKEESFQVWKLDVLSGKALLNCGDGNGRILFHKHIDWTDLEDCVIEIWWQNGVMMLPSEY